MRAFLRILVGTAVMQGLVGSAQTADSGEAAFKAARAVAEPGTRVASLLAFVREHPESALVGRATRLALETDLAFFPERTDEIHGLATRDVNSERAGLDRWIEEAKVAGMLASAGESGADLVDAKLWAQQALAGMTEESFRREVTASQARFKLPPLGSRQVHRDFVGYRAAFLAAMANVDLRLGQAEAARPLLAEAYLLNPLSEEVNSLRGQLALVQHRDGEALEDFERAAAAGALGARWRAEMVRLYGAAHADGEAGLERRIDAAYERMYPPVYSLPPRRLQAGGHTVLLELFTGSGCEPCMAPDLAVESLLKTYSRQDLVVLEWDENIPRPDPLANRSSEARAQSYRAGTTPEAFLDGESLPVAGSTRADAENVVIGFADAVEQQAAQPTGVALSLTASRDAQGKVTARATVAQRTGERSTLHFALVQDGIRYSGENGMRFHRMVVRATESGRTVSADAKGSVTEARFDLPAIGAELRAYLDAYEKNNDRFGPVTFLTKDLPIDPAQVAVVAWVEDAASHEVLQAAYAPVPAS